MLPAACETGVGRLSLLASAVAGRRLDVAQSESEATYTDGRTVFLGPDIDPANPADTVAAQAALLAAGSLHPGIVARLRFHRSGVVERYLGLELRRAAVALSGFLPPSTVARLNLEVGAYETSQSGAQSFRVAIGHDPVPPPPAWAGGLNLSALRRADPRDLRGRSRELDGVAVAVPDRSRRLRDSVRRLFGSDEAKTHASSGAQEMAVGAGNRSRAVGPVEESLLASGAPRNSGFRHPEWDCHRGAYRQDWCTVVESEAAELGIDSAAADSSPWNSLAPVGLEVQRHRRQPDGHDLDLAALVDFHIDRARGARPDTSIYETTLRTRRDLSVLVLLDCSGSTAEDSGAGSVFDEERRLAGEVTAALERLGDQVGTYGFCSWGRGAVNIWRIKEFGKRFDAGARGRLAAARPSGFTRMGAAIRHATWILETTALARNMVLLVIGDGMPYDDGYEDRYARADTRQAIEEAMQRGIAVVGIGVRSSTSSAVLEEVWAQASFRVVGRSGDARAMLRPMLLDALKVIRGNGRRRTPSSGLDDRHLQQFRRAHRASRNTYL